ncbi:MAG: thiamine-phosphate kinase [Kiritimatiellae bacterium]|nr:thiamine-phosphate kinase [Verrucomicrobiota bacterium]MBU4366046.1 thiamine-phosphate kinase [Verrucomicrobiota bacterium]MCG2661239.1 thiamine-phosphate kinase [Kiritimatiellia bacterium]
MKKIRQQTVGDLGEWAVIQRLVCALPERNATHPPASPVAKPLRAGSVAGGPERADVVVGPGDDCAVVRPADDARYDYLLKSDPVIEGVHFTRATPGATVGHKALARVLSDIAAMGGEPLWALVNLVAPDTMPVARVTGIYSGLSRLSRHWRVAIVGGDVTSGPRLEAHVFGVGRVPRGQAVLRSGACSGDYLFVTGALGGSRRGKHLAFQPRLAEGRWLQNRRWATAMIDLSDGLATDLRHLIRQSRVGAELFLTSIPLASAISLGGLARRVKQSASRRTALRGAGQALRGAGQALRHAFCDGEDYELLFTVSPANAATLIRAWPKTFRTPCTYIGRITDRRDVIECVDARGRKVRLKATGYEHFR